jgi:D-glucosaminate-6-phosphate ammonia-lyase
VSESRLRQRSAPAQAGSGQAKGWIYRELGVEPLINCAGVRTQYGGSHPAPEVLAAMNAAAEAFVDLDELAEGVGKRLSALSGAEWGIVTSSTTAALSLATAACIAGNNPELMLRLPRTGDVAHHVVMVAGQRFDYDHAILAAGAEIVCATDMAHLETLLAGPAVMICLLARQDSHVPLQLRAIAPVAKRRDVPILVDAAGLSPSNPDRWLQEGADLVVYAGGKYLRGPQSTALLLGREALCRAAWLNGPPHQAFGRSMKVGKEELVGAVAALQRWLTSPTTAQERAEWSARLERVRLGLRGLEGIATALLPSSPSVTAPRLKIEWDSSRIALHSDLLRARLLAGSPRILIHDFWSKPHSIVIDPVNLTDIEAEHVANALRTHLAKAYPVEARPEPRPGADFTGSWAARLRFLRGVAEHKLHLEQRGEQIHGEHVATYSTARLTGKVESGVASFTAKHVQEGMARYYSFEATLNGDTLAGHMWLGAASEEHSGPVFQRQFGAGTWVARRAARQRC